MKTSLPSRLSLLRHATVLSAISLFAAYAYAAAPVPVGPVLALKVVQGTTRTVRSGAGKPGAGGGMPKGGGGGGGGKGGGGTTTSSSNNIFYTITLSNTSPIEAKDVVVEYTVWNQTATLNNGDRNTVIEPITGTETVDVPASGKIDVDTKDIPNKDSETRAKPAGGGGKKGGGTIGSPKVTAYTKQEVQGYIVTVKLGDKVVLTKESASGIKRKMETAMSGKK